MEDLLTEKAHMQMMFADANTVSKSEEIHDLWEKRLASRKLHSKRSQRSQQPGTQISTAWAIRDKLVWRMKKRLGWLYFLWQALCWPFKQCFGVIWGALKPLALYGYDKGGGWKGITCALVFAVSHPLATSRHKHGP
jgi:hypothetical protein